VLGSYRGNPAVDVVLDDVIGQIESCFAALSTLSGKRAVPTENDWLMSIRSRVGIGWHV
jgi:hypothetical protein